MRLIDADKLCASLVDWSLCEMPEEGVNYISGRMVTDHERQYELFLQLEDVLKEISEQEIVKTIPIEWIKKWCNTQNGKSLEERLLKRYGVLTLLEDWEKENGNQS